MVKLDVDIFNICYIPRFLILKVIKKMEPISFSRIHRSCKFSHNLCMKSRNDINIYIRKSLVVDYRPENSFKIFHADYPYCKNPTTIPFRNQDHCSTICYFHWKEINMIGPFSTNILGFIFFTSRFRCDILKIATPTFVCWGPLWPKYIELSAMGWLPPSTLLAGTDLWHRKSVTVYLERYRDLEDAIHNVANRSSNLKIEALRFKMHLCEILDQYYSKMLELTRYPNHGKFSLKIDLPSRYSLWKAGEVAFHYLPRTSWLIQDDTLFDNLHGKLIYFFPAAEKSLVVLYLTVELISVLTKALEIKCWVYRRPEEFEKFWRESKKMKKAKDIVTEVEWEKKFEEVVEKYFE